MSKKMLVLTLAASVAALASSASGALVAWWPFNNSPNDQVGALNWTLNGGATYSTDCKEGSSSLLCDGVDDRATLAGSGLMSAVFSTKTVALWFKANSTTKTQVIYDEGGGTQGWAIHLQNDALEAAVSASSVVAILSTPFSSLKWSHVAMSFDNGLFKLYLNGKEVASTTASFTSVATHANGSGLGATNAGNAFIGATTGDNFGGLIDDVRMYDQALSPAEIRSLCGSGALAANVSPKDGATDVPRDTPLTWMAGETAGTHDVYLGTTFADVNTASRTSPKGVLLSQGQANTTFNAGRLQFGQTYFWRIDEVNASPDSTVFKGDVWSFTTEPLAYPVDGKTITATASSAVNGQGPENTINGFGLTGDLHANDASTMWLSVPGDTGPVWIQYAFDRLIQLHEMWIWNHNTLLEAMLGFGAKDIIIEYSTDGTTFQTLGTTHQFARASGQPTYTYNTVVSFGDVAVKYVKLTIQNNWGGILAQYGLSEVRFLAVPVYAREPNPAAGAMDVAPQAVLTWRAGREAGSHQVFLGTDPNKLTLATTVQKPSFDVDLNLNQTYYWKVAEGNQAKDPTTWTSNVWSFATQKFLVVEDFESYTDEEGKAIFQTWADGYGVAANGSQVGNANPPYAERMIILGGKQAMPLFYSNTAGATYSEAERTFATAQDWTKYGCKTLALSFYGDPNNTGQMYLKINSTKIPYNGQPADLQRAQWQPWNIDLAASGASLKSVTKIALGIDGAGAAGVLRFDDIRLYPTAGATITPVDPGKTGLVAWYQFDGDFKDAAGTHTATAVGDAKIVSDPLRGQVVSLDGTGDGAAVPLLGSVNTLTIAVWVNTAVDPVPIQYEGIFHANGWEAQDLHWRYQYGKLNPDINGGGGALTGISIVKPNQWNHVAVTVSPTEFAVWLNGYKEASRTLPAPVGVTLGDGMLGAWLGTDGVTISRTFTGRMDDARFYNRALSAEELAFLAGRTGPVAQAF